MKYRVRRGVVQEADGRIRGHGSHSACRHRGGRQATRGGGHSKVRVPESRGVPRCPRRRQRRHVQGISQHKIRLRRQGVHAKADDRNASQHRRGRVQGTRSGSHQRGVIPHIHARGFNHIWLGHDKRRPDHTRTAREEAEGLGPGREGGQCRRDRREHVQREVSRGPLCGGVGSRHGNNVRRRQRAHLPRGYVRGVSRRGPLVRHRRRGGG